MIAMLHRRLIKRTAFSAAALAFLAACQASGPQGDPGAPSGEDIVETPAEQAPPPQARFAPIAPPEPADRPGLRAPPPDLAAAPAPPPPPPATPERTRVAMLLPLSGPQAPLGRAMQDAAQLALFTLADTKFELIFEDTGGAPRQAASAARAALNKGAGLILGPLLSTSVRAVGPVARRAGVNVVAFTTDRTVAGDGVFVMGMLPRAEIERVVSYAAAQGLARFAAIAPRTAYGEIALSEFNRAVARNQSAVVAAELYAPGGGTDFSQIVRNFVSFDKRAAQLEAQRAALGAQADAAAQRTLAQLEGRKTAGDVGFDALFLPDGAGGSVLSIAPFLPFFDVQAPTVRLLGTGLWDEPATLSEPALIGGWFAAPEPAQRRAFEQDFQQSYGQPPQRLATLAYDAAALAAVLARSPNPNPFGAAAIADPAGFIGVDGVFRFRADGVVDRAFAVLEVVEGGAKVVDQAATTFEAIGN